MISKAVELGAASSPEAFGDPSRAYRGGISGTDVSLADVAGGGSDRQGADAEPRDNVKKSTIAAAFAVLRLLARTNQKVGVNAIARELSLPASSCFKILRALSAEGCIEFDETTKCYSIGVGTIMLARSALDPADVFTTVRSHLEEVAAEAAVALGMWRIVAGERMVLIGFIEGSGDLRLHMRPGQRLPMYIGALGRAIAASREDSVDKLRSHFEKLRWEVPPRFEDYRRQVSDARQAGYAFDEGHFSPGVTTIASVICDRSGCARYGLSAITLARPSAPPQIEHVGPIVRDAARWVRQRLFASCVGLTASDRSCG